MVPILHKPQVSI